MGIRQQVYLTEAERQMLEEESRVTGLSVSELVRRAIHLCYGPGRRLGWEEVFAHSVRVSPGGVEQEWIYDGLFDETPDAALRESGDNSEMD